MLGTVIWAVLPGLALWRILSYKQLNIKVLDFCFQQFMSEWLRSKMVAYHMRDNLNGLSYSHEWRKIKRVDLSTCFSKWQLLIGSKCYNNLIFQRRLHINKVVWFTQDKGKVQMKRGKRQKDPANRIWTGDLRISGIDNYSPPLYQLSYRRASVDDLKALQF